MATQARIVWDESFTGYDFGEGHPMNPIRLDLTARLCRALGLFEEGEVDLLVPEADAGVLATRIATGRIALVLDSRER